MHPTRKKLICWDQNPTSNWIPHHSTAISMPRVTTSFLPTRLKIMLIVQMKIFQRQYKLKKCPKTLKYLPWSVSDHLCRSCISFISCNSRNNWRASSSSPLISNLSCPMSEKWKKNHFSVGKFLNFNFTFMTRRLVSHRSYKAPNWVFGIVWLLLQSVATINRNSLLLSQHHVQGLHKFSFSRHDIVLCHRMNEIIHVCKRKVYCTKTT